MKPSVIETDLVIIGGGGSGLAAAVRARELGLERVTILEKTGRTGGNAWLAVVMLGLGDPIGLDGDLNEWRDQTFGGLMQAGKWTLDPKLIHSFVDTYPDMVRWLIAKGLKFDVNGFDVGGRRFSTLCFKERKGDYKVSDPARGPGFLGHFIGDLLAEEARRLSIDIRLKTRAAKILLSEDGTAVRGVLATGPDGEIEVQAPRVILSAGGFAANEEMMRRYCPDEFQNEGPINLLCLGSQTGDGQAMAEEIGLLFGDDMDSGVIAPGHHPWSHSLHEAVHRPEMLWVNTNGERFVNESLSVMAGWAIQKQPQSLLWALFDADTMAHIVAEPSPRQAAMNGTEWLKPLPTEIVKEAAWTRRTAAIAGSVEELAEQIGVPAVELQATIDRYNSLCDERRDSDFVKPAEFLRPLRTPPFYGVLGARFCHGSEGGAKVDGSMAVRKLDGSPVAGLWATGDNTSGWVVHWGLPGTTLGFAFTSGYIAGTSAASFADC